MSSRSVLEVAALRGGLRPLLGPGRPAPPRWPRASPGGRGTRRRPPTGTGGAATRAASGRAAARGARRRRRSTSPSIPEMRPMAESRRFGSNSSSTVARSLPAVAEERLQRPREPPVAVAEVRAQHGLEGLRGALVRGRGSDRRTARTRPGPRRRSGSRPCSAAPSARSGSRARRGARGRPRAGRRATPRAGRRSASRRSTSMRSPATRTPAWLVGKETMRASMARTLAGARRDSCLSRQRLSSRGTSSSSTARAASARGTSATRRRSAGRPTGAGRTGSSSSSPARPARERELEPVVPGDIGRSRRSRTRPSSSVRACVRRIGRSSSPSL